MIVQLRIARSCSSSVSTRINISSHLLFPRVIENHPDDRLGGLYEVEQEHTLINDI